MYPRSYIDRQFEETAQAFEWRFEKYGADRFFAPWTPDRPVEDIHREFQHLHEQRFSIWYMQPPGWYDTIEVNEDFLFADHLFFTDAFRAGNCLAFAYNQTHPSFNSSNIVMGQGRFLAMEGTRSAQETSFFHLLTAYQVTHLVRLTPAFDTQKKCHPYWEGRTEHTDLGTWLRLPLRGGSSYSLHYFEVEDWVDHQAIDAGVLIALIEEVRANYDPQTDLLAVHCSAGVGRTGTFLAAWVLMHEIDRQRIAGNDVHVSIEEVVFKLNLQRKYMVTRKEQYQMLYELVGIYLMDR